MNKSHTVKLMDWTKHRYGEEYKNLISHQTANGEFAQLPMWVDVRRPKEGMEKEALIIGHRCGTRRSNRLLRESEEALVLTLRNFSPFSFQSKTVRRAVLEVTDCLDHVPNVSLMPAMGAGTGTTEHLSNGRAGAPPPCESALQPPILGYGMGLFRACGRHNPRSIRKQTPWRRRSLPKENVDPNRFSWLECESLPLPQLRDEEEPFPVEEMSSKRRSPMRVVGQR